MSFISKMRSVLGTVLKTVLIDPNVNAAKTQITEPIERLSDSLKEPGLYKLNQKQVDLLIRDGKITKLIEERDRDREHYDTNDWKDWRERYDAVQ